MDNNEKKPFLSPVKIAVIAVVAIVVVAIAANGKAFANTVKKAFSSPDKYYQSVEANSIMQSAETVTSVYDQVTKILDLKDLNQSVTISAELGAKLQKLIKKEAEIDISDLGSVSVSFDTMMKKDILGLGAGLSVGKKSLASINAILDMKDLKAYIQIPELNKKYIGIDVEEEFDADNYQEKYENAKSMFSGLPKKKEVDKIMERYIKAALSEVTKVTKSNATIEAGEVSMKCTALEVEIDEDVLADMIEAVAKELEKDKDLRKLLEKALAEIDEDAADDISDKLDELAEELYDAAEEIGKAKLDITMTVYVDGKGSICGRTVNMKVSQSYENWYGETVTETVGGEAELLFPVKGSKAGFLATVKTKDDEGNKEVLFKAEGSGKVSMGTLSGDMKIKVRGVSLADVSVKKLDLDKAKKGYPNGTITISASDTIAGMLEKELSRDFRDFLEEAGINLSKVGLEFSFDTSAKSSKIGVTAVYKDEMLFKVSAARDTKADVDTKVPAEKNVIMVEDRDDLFDWFEECDWDGFLKNLKKASLPKDLMELLENAIEELEDIDSADELPFGGRADTSTVPVYRGDDYYDYDWEY